MKRTITASLLAALGLAASAQGDFMENFDDGAASTRWSTPIVDSELATFDGAVDYAFDYGAAGIPAAPGGGGSIGLRIFANQTDEATTDEGESIVVIANDAVMPAGDFIYTVDVYYNVNSGSEDVATEYVGLGAYVAAPNAPADFGLNDDAPFRFGVSNGNGVNFQVTGDGGSATDVVQFLDPGNANAGSQSNIGSLDSIPFGTIPGVTTGAGNPNNPFESFGFQNRWVTASIESAAGMIDFKINGASLLTALGEPLVDNTGGELTGGSILLGLNDVFNSAAGAGVFTVFDNVSLAVPEPTSAVLALAGLAAFAARRRG